VERGEFLNVGVVLFARERAFLKASFEVDEPRLRCLAPDVDLSAVERHLHTFNAVCDGHPEGGPIAAMPMPERFHWLVSPRSTMIQTSEVHPGRSDDPEAALQELLDEFVRPVRQAQTARADGA
jgi:hypothetical protein